MAVQALGAARVWELVKGAAVAAQDREDCAAHIAAEGRPSRRGGRLEDGLARWRSRAMQSAPEEDLHQAARMGGGYVIPGDEAWPVALDDLGPARPLGLWWRGPGFESLARLGAGPWSEARLLAVIGTRDPSAYGIHVTEQLVTGLRERDVCILSGGALGIDVAAHRTALEIGEGRPATMAVLAGGIDRLYPAANSATLSVIGRRHLLLSEHPPGTSTARWRFLARNRIIAALGCGTLVTEGRWRSGALNTANSAAELGRWVGAVPGPITSGESELPHRLIREAGADLVTCVQDVVGDLGWDGAESGATPTDGQAQLPFPNDPEHPTDGMDPVEERLWEALPRRGGLGLDQLVSAAGLSVSEALAGLERLAGRGAAAEVPGGGWKRG
ncbi:DNA-processing protein DprA [Galactobacter sp.]|uniref:DNA-processing protein DprA n=1 Tax=Galactobacter sp. TaxID=2676125 RepID=UPI0025C612CB|nr:DNA-processing protein DprA [Galactobacter sp.]